MVQLVKVEVKTHCLAILIESLQKNFRGSPARKVETCQHYVLTRLEGADKTHGLSHTRRTTEDAWLSAYEPRRHKICMTQCVSSWYYYVCSGDFVTF